MRSTTIREKLLSKYIPTTPKTRTDLFFRSHSPKAKGSTLEEFYREVHAKHSVNKEEPYQNKNAKEIESMMMQNRKLIEMQRKNKQ